MIKDNDVTQQNYNNLNYLQLIFIALSIQGFEAITFLYAKSSESTSDFSFIYRFIYLLFGIFVLVYSGKKYTFNYSGKYKVVLLFWGIYLVKGIFDTLYFYSEGQTIIIDSFWIIDETMVNKFWLYGFFLCFLPMFPVSIPINKRTLNSLQNFVFLLSVTVNILSIINNLEFAALDTYGKRAGANIILNPITYGESGIILVILSFIFAVHAKSKIKFLYILLMILGFVNLGLSASRGPLLEITGVIAFYLIYRKNKNILVKVGIITILVLIIIFIFDQYLYLFEGLYGRILFTGDDELRSLLLIKSWNAFISNPFLGTHVIGEYSHNIIVASLMVMGIIGGILILVIYKNAIVVAKTLIKIQSTEWVGLLLIMYLISALVSGAIWNSYTLWPLLALSFNLYSQRKLYI